MIRSNKKITGERQPSMAVFPHDHPKLELIVVKIRESLTRMCICVIYSQAAKLSANLSDSSFPQAYFPQAKQALIVVVLVAVI